MSYIRYVNTASVGGDGTTNNTTGSTAAYVSIVDCISGEETSLSDDLIIELCGSADDSGGADFALFTSANWTMNGFTITARGNDSLSSGAHDGVWDDNAYTISVSISGVGYGLRNEGVSGLNLERFQIENTNAGAESSYVVRLTDGAETNINGLIVRNHTNGQGIHIEDSGSNTNIRNSIVYSINMGAESEGISSDVSFNGTINIDNTVTYNFDDGMERDNAQTTNVQNSISFGSTAQDWDALSSVTYSASDDSQAGTGNIQPANWDAEFTDYTNFDFTILDTDAEIYGAGTDLSGEFTTDITGATRSVWSMGPFDAPGGGEPPTSGNPWFYYLQQQLAA